MKKIVWLVILIIFSINFNSVSAWVKGCDEIKNISKECVYSVGNNKKISFHISSGNMIFESDVEKIYLCRNGLGEGGTTSGYVDASKWNFSFSTNVSGFKNKCPKLSVLNDSSSSYNEVSFDNVSGVKASYSADTAQSAASNDICSTKKCSNVYNINYNGSSYSVIFTADNNNEITMYVNKYSSNGFNFNNAANKTLSSNARTMTLDTPYNLSVRLKDKDVIYNGNSFNSSVYVCTKNNKKNEFIITSSPNDSECLTTKNISDSAEYHSYMNMTLPTNLQNSTVDLDELLGSSTDAHDLAYYLHIIIQVIKYAAFFMLIVLTVVDYVKAFCNLKDFSAANKNAVYRFVLVILLFVGAPILNIILDLFGISPAAI